MDRREKEIEEKYYRDLNDEIEECRIDIQDNSREVIQEENSGLQSIVIVLSIVLSISPLFLLAEKTVSFMELFFSLNEIVWEYLLFWSFFLILLGILEYKKSQIWNAIKDYLNIVKESSNIYKKLRDEKIELRKKSDENYKKSISNKKK